jgi:hypothetical protein
MPFKMKGFPFSGNSALKQKEMTGAGEAGATAGAASRGASTHPLYEKLTASEKKAYNALTPEEKTNVNKNKTLSQLKSALGGYEPDYEGGD